MLPSDIVEFLHGPQVMAIGTRSAKLRPAMGRVLGAFADAAQDRVSLFLPNVQCEPHLTNLADNGSVAMTAGEARSHRNYQFKGRVVDVRASTPGDIAIRDVYIDKLIRYFREEYFMPLPDNFFGELYRRSIDHDHVPGSEDFQSDAGAERWKAGRFRSGGGLSG